MKLAHIAIASLLSMSVSSRAAADSEAPCRSQIFAGWRAYFVMVAAPGAEYEDEHPEHEGRAYAIVPGEDVLLWKVRGWCAHVVHFSPGGRYLVRLGGWPEGSVPSDEDVAIEFYDKGKLLRRYSTLDLVHDPSAVEPWRSISHYRVVDRVLGRTDGCFSLTTLEGYRYTFDMTNGATLNVSPVADQSAKCTVMLPKEENEHSSHEESPSTEVNAPPPAPTAPAVSPAPAASSAPPEIRGCSRCSASPHDRDAGPAWLIIALLGAVRTRRRRM